MTLPGSDGHDGQQHPLRILHISTYDRQGGAARSAWRIHQSLLMLGLASSMLVWRKTSEDKHIWQHEPPRDLFNRFLQRIRRELRQKQHNRYTSRRRDSFQPFSDDRTDFMIDLHHCVPQPTIVTLCWISGFLDYSYFFRHLPADIPIVWRLSDMNPFTGGCHYACECEKWQKQCGACPELGSNKQNDLSHRIWQRKQRAYRDHEIHVVAPSHWLAREAERSGLLRDQPVTVIPNGVDTQIFKPLDRAQVRAELDLPQQSKIVLAVAAHLNDKRKGISLLIEALQILAVADDLILLTVGETKEDRFDSFLRRINLGHISEDASLAKAYAAADLFVAPSLYENLPNTALEAMACGIPIVSFNVGGMPDIVRTGVTGLLANSGDAANLALQINWLLDHAVERQNMGLAARKIVENEFDCTVEAQRFADLYQNLATQPTQL